MKALRQQATVICKSYTEDALQPHDQFDEDALVSAKLRERTIAYVKEWPAAVPLRGIIIGQHPHDTTQVPPLAAAFASEEGEEADLMAKIMANQMCLCSPDAKQSSVLASIQSCWKLTAHGVLSVHAMPLGPAQDSKGPTRGRPWEVHQIGCLSTALAKLLIVSSQAGDQGRVIVVALGKWAEVVAKRVEEMVVADEFWSQGWVLERHDLHYPGYLWHKHRKERLPIVEMGPETGLRALLFLFTSARSKAAAPPPPSAHKQQQAQKPPPAVTVPEQQQPQQQGQKPAPAEAPERSAGSRPKPSSASSSPAAERKAKPGSTPTATGDKDKVRPAAASQSDEKGCPGEEHETTGGGGKAPKPPYSEKTIHHVLQYLCDKWNVKDKS